MRKEIIEAIFEEAVDAGGDFYEIDPICKKFHELLEAVYKLEGETILGQLSEEALKAIDKEIKNEKSS